MRLLWLIGLLGICANALAQTSGKVEDSKDGTVLPGAHVVAYSLPDSVMRAYAITDKNGDFSIGNCPKTPFFLRATCMGYAKKDVYVAPSTKSPIEIKLSAKSFNLNEVSVRRRAPGAVVKGDTMTYNISHYTDGTEQVLGDVLDKLPGVTVDESGRVKAEGKAVDKLLLNGQDFAGERHDVLTKNLPSEMVQSVELIKNYNTFSLLDGFKSKGTAINIGVDSAYVRRPTGNVELWGGAKDKFRARANLFFIGDAAMWSASGRYFNTGEESMSTMDYMQICGGVKNFAQAITGRTSAVERPVDNSATFLANDVSTRKRSDVVASSNVAWNPSDKLSIKAFIIHSGERSKSGQTLTRTFFAKPDEPTLSIAEGGKRKKSITTVSLDAKMDTHAKDGVAYRGLVVFAPDDDDHNYADHGEQNQQTDATTTHTEHDITHTHKFSKNQLLTLRAYYVYDYDKTTVGIESDTLILPLPSVNGTQAWQTRRRKTTMAGASASFIQRLGKPLRLRASVAVDADKAYYSSESGIEALSQDESHASCTATTIGLSLQKTHGVFQFDVGAQAVHVASSTSDVNWRLLPQASIEFEFSKLNSLTIEYESSFLRDGSAPWTTSLRLSDYRSLECYEPEREMLHLSHSIWAIYTYFDALTDVSLIAHAGLDITENPTAQTYASEGYGVIEARRRVNTDEHLVLGSVDFQKGFAFPLMLKVKGKYTRSTYDEIYDDLTCGTTIDKAEGEVSLQTRFKTLINMEAGATASYSHLDMDILSDPTEWLTYGVRLQPIAVSEKAGLAVKVPVTYVCDKASGSKLDYVDIGLSASKKIGSHLSLFAEAKDLLHTDDRDRITRSVSGDHEDVSHEARMPGYLIAGIKFIF